MENLTYVKDSRTGREAAEINGIVRFKLGGIGVIYRSDFEDGQWQDYQPIAKSVSTKTEFYEHMITVAQHAAEKVGAVANMITSLRTVLGDGVALHVGMDGERLETGYQLAPEQNERIPEGVRKATGWYDMTAEGMLVTAFMPELFPEESVELAREAIAEDYPEIATWLEETHAMRR